MRALVTGGAGQIGSHIVDALLRRGWDVTVLDNLDPVTHPGGRPPWVPGEVRFVEGEVTDGEAAAKALEGVQVVFHEAAYQGLLPDFSKFFCVNGAGTALIYETIVAQVHLMFAAFMLGVPMFAVVVEYVGMRAGEKRSGPG